MLRKTKVANRDVVSVLFGKHLVSFISNKKGGLQTGQKRS